jgi:hypothetical protein
MKKLYPVLIIALFLLAPVIRGKAQATDNWQPVTLNINGTNGFDGVKAYWELTTCNNIEVVMLDFVNNNNYAVRASWKNFVINNDDAKLPSSIVQDSVTIPANSSLKADCSGNNKALVLKLSDFAADKYNFKTFTTTGFDFVIVH